MKTLIIVHELEINDLACAYNNLEVDSPLFFIATSEDVKISKQMYKNDKNHKYYKITDMNKTISRTKATELINNTKGKFFTVTFRKQNGTERTLNGKYNTTTKLGYLNIYSMKDKGFRNVNPRTLLSLKVDNKTYFIK